MAGCRVGSAVVLAAAVALLSMAPASGAALRGKAAAGAMNPADELENDGTYKYYDSSKDTDSPVFVSPGLRDRWRHSQLSRWDVGNPLPQSAPPGTVKQTKDGTPSDFWPTPLNPPAYESLPADGGAFVG